MRLLLTVTLLSLLARPEARSAVRTPPQVQPQPRRCVPTAPMPVLEDRTTPRDSMPTVRPDAKRVERMLVIPLRACYLG